MTNIQSFSLSPLALIVCFASSAIAQPPEGPPSDFGQPPLPPVIEALDKNNDGELSSEELNGAAEALRTLDKNKDGKLNEAEVVPDFGGRGRGNRRDDRGFEPGGPGGFGPPGFGPPDFGPGGFGRGGGRGGDRGGQRSEPMAPEDLDPKDGTATIPDRATYEMLSYQGREVMIDTHLADLEFVKFQIEGADTDDPTMYFINTKTHRAHMMFGRVAGIGGRGGPGRRGPGGGSSMRGVLVYRPMLKGPAGQAGSYTFEFEPWDAFPFEKIQLARNLLVKKAPILKDRIGFFPLDGAMPLYKKEKTKYDESDVIVYLEDDLYSDIGFLPLNIAKSYGRLRIMELGQQPSARDVVIYRSLPNEMPRTAGIITTVRQTPLSHVNLRAIQDKIPNSFIADAIKVGEIESLIGKMVYYEVTPQRFMVREATEDELNQHFDAIRPAKPQSPPRNLTIRKYRALAEIQFGDAESFGVKTTNLAAMHTFELPEGTVPDGVGIPFAYYDDFMKHNGLYAFAHTMIADSEFKRSDEIRELRLSKFRKKIRAAEMPEWIQDSLTELHRSFPEGTALRCRSSTNNEDLPGFSGAGLYDSCTHRPDEGHLSKSVKQVFASLWNYRAFDEREFYRVDHFATAMGVLVHPNFDNEQANGVAVTEDVLYRNPGAYYLNVQVGEDLVTNPDEQSIPEEVTLSWYKRDGDRLMRPSNRIEAGERILKPEQLDSMRTQLARIHSKFAKLYKRSMRDENFAMEVEFKITDGGQLIIKQARPWVFSK